LKVEALKWFHQETGLWTVFGSFCPQGKLQLGSEVTRWQLMKSVQIYCCFCHVADVLLYSCKYGWSVPPQARWGNSVLSTTLNPTRLAQQSIMAPLLEVGLSSHPHYQY
jgi:hypothetical protein